MILSMIFHFIKTVLGAVIKAIAWLLVSLSLWVPLLYALIFVIACGLTGASISALSAWFWGGLAVSFVGSFAISTYLYERNLNRKKKEKVKSSLEKATEKTEEQGMKKSRRHKNAGQTQPVLGESTSESSTKTTKTTVTATAAQEGMDEIRQEMASKHGFAVYDALNPTQTQSNQAQMQAQGSQAMQAQSSFQGGYADNNYQQAVQNGYSAGYQSGYQSGFNSAPPVQQSFGYNQPTQQNYGFNQQGFSQQGFSQQQNMQSGVQQNYGFNQQESQAHQSGQGGYGFSQAQGFSQPQAESFSQSGQSGFTQSRRGRNLDNYDEYRGIFDSPVLEESDYSKHGFSSGLDGFFKGGTSDSFDSQRGEGRSAMNSKTSEVMSSERVSGEMMSDVRSTSGEKRTGDKPNIFAVKNDPTIFICEYSDRLEYYKRTKQGMVLMDTKRKTS